MKKFIYFAMFVFGLLFISCHRQFTDNIQLSGNTYNFSANGDSAIITSKGTGWWFADVILDSTHYLLPQPASDCKLNYIDSNFQIERRSCDTLFVKMNANTTNLVRVLWIQLEAGDFFTSVTFIQDRNSQIH